MRDFGLRLVRGAALFAVILGILYCISSLIMCVLLYPRIPWYFIPGAVISVITAIYILGDSDF